MIRRLARPMLASVFIIDGVETLRNPQARVENAAPLVDKATPLVEKGEQAVNERVSTNVPPVPKDTETLVKALAGVKVGAGVLFALGKAPRLSALALTASHVPTTVSRHAFWMESDPAARSRKTTGLATDVALLGALILATADTAGQPGLGWRARKVGDKVSAKLPGAKSETAAAGAAIAGVAATVADQARSAADTVKEKAPVVADTVKEKAPEVADQVREQATSFADVVREKVPVVAAQVRDQASAAREQAAPLAAQVREQAAVARETASPAAASALEQIKGQAGAAAAAASAGAHDARERAAVAREVAAARAAEVDTDQLRADAGAAAERAKLKSDRARLGLARIIAP